jgi:hypothetical protein
MQTTCLGLQDPGGTISKSGRSATGSLTETDLIAAVTVPSGDAHHLTDFKFAVAKGAAGTIFRLYGSADSDDPWTQIDDFEIGDYGIFSETKGVSHKFKAGERWKVTVQQSTIARCAVQVGGQARSMDVRDF